MLSSTILGNYRVPQFLSNKHACFFRFLRIHRSSLYIKCYSEYQNATPQQQIWSKHDNFLSACNVQWLCSGAPIQYYLEKILCGSSIDRELLYRLTSPI